MKTIQHDFLKENVAFENGEVISKDEIISLTFSLPLSALGLFEEEYGKPLIDVIINNTSEDNFVNGHELDNINFIRALASCMYIKIDNGQVINNESSKEEFKNMEIYNTVASEVGLRKDLIECAIMCINDRARKTNKKNTSKSKK